MFGQPRVQGVVLGGYHSQPYARRKLPRRRSIYDIAAARLTETHQVRLACKLGVSGEFQYASSSTIRLATATSMAATLGKFSWSYEAPASKICERTKCS